MSNYYDLAQTESILRGIQGLNLSRPESLDEASIIELQSQFNGCGSDAMPAVLRKALSAIMWILVYTIAIHDWRYYMSDGTKEGQAEADYEFFLNGHKEIYAKLAWWNPLRYWALYKLNVAYKLLQKFGYSAYKSACKKYNKS